MNPLARIIDASVNRAREALRVMEDAARFGLDDPALIAAVKGLRHDLRSALEQPVLDAGVLLAARDTEGDEGREIKTAQEGVRGSLYDIAAAASARLSEALRSIEESAKALGADPGPVERLRYRAYTVQRDLLLALGQGRCPQWRLCVLITESLCRRGWTEVALAAIRGGADCLQLREKGLPDRELVERARRLVGLARDSGTRVSVIVNDRVDLALAAEADGVHLGQEDLDAAAARRIAGFRLLIGVSTANLEQAKAAARAGADYCGVGPMFATTTKHKPVLSGPEYLRAYLADPVAGARPHLAIGGITPENARGLREAGCRGVAVSSAVCSADDPEGVCARLVEALQGA